MRDLSAPLLRGCSCLLVTLLLAGCPGGDTNSEPSETAGGALEGKSISLNAVGTIGDSPTWDLAIAEWEAATGAACVQTVLSTAVPDDVEPAVTETPGLMVVPLLGLPDLIQARARRDRSRRCRRGNAISLAGAVRRSAPRRRRPAGTDHQSADRRSAAAPLVPGRPAGTGQSGTAAYLEGIRRAGRHGWRMGQRCVCRRALGR